ncbi:MAG: hypothetical protein L0Y64_19530 [Myxococcaceae bacterium]|nr:hypothetical protein [Myxococcaceae bacterium]
MFPLWSEALRQQLTNAVLARYSIPVEVVPTAAPDGSRCWELSVTGGTLEAVLERMHAVQDRIIRRISMRGMQAVSRHDALFMYVSQWLEWTFAGGEATRDHVRTLELMEGWAVLYTTRGDRFLS